MKHLKLMIPVMFCAMLATTNVFAQDENAAEIPVQPAESVEIQAESAETQGQNAESVQNEYVQPVQNGYVETAYEQPAQDVYVNQNQAYVVQNNGVQPIQYSNSVPYSAGNTVSSGLRPESYWNPGFSIGAKIGPELEIAGILSYWIAYGGISGGIELGYHWNIFGIYASQQFSGTWGFNDDRTFDSAEDAEDYNRKNNRFSSAMGLTAVDVRWFLSDYERLRFSIGCGLGFAYLLKSSSNDDDDDDSGVIPLIRFHFGVNYLLTPNLSLGFRLDYSGFSFWIVHYHQIEPAFTVSYTF